MYFFPNLEPVHCSMSGSNCCFLTSYMFLRRQERWSGSPIAFRIFHSLLWSTESKASLHSQWSRNMYFSGILSLFLWSKDVGNLIYGSSAFSKTSLNIWKLLVHILLKPSLKDFEYYLATCEMSAIVWLSILWHCLSLGLEWKLTFSSPVATAEFSKSVGMLSAAL